MAQARGFGAAGDGRTDDTAALQHALDDGDGVLELPRGTYRITRPLVLDLARTGPLGVRGDGGTARLVMAGPGPALRLVGTHGGTAEPTTVRDATWTRERFPVVTGLEILGDHPEAVGIELDGTMQATVTGVLIRRCRDGIHLVGRNRNVLLADAHLYDGLRYGVFLDRVNLHQIEITGCHISYNKRAGIKSLDGDVHNLQIVGNDIEYNHDTGAEGSADIDFEATEGVISEVTIAGNTIQAKPSPGGANVRVVGAPGATLTNARILTIAGNVIGSQEVNVHLRHVQRVTLTGNTIYDGHRLGLLAQHCEGLALAANTHGWSYQPERNVPDGLRFEDCAVGSVSGQILKDCRAGDGCISLVRCRDLAVSECQVRDPAVRGIWLDDCQRCRVAGNTITEEAARMRAAIELTGAGRDNWVLGNLVTAGREGAIRCPPESGRAEGNRVVG